MALLNISMQITVIVLQSRLPPFSLRFLLFIFHNHVAKTYLKPRRKVAEPRNEYS
jgi:hypothetical protein